MNTFIANDFFLGNIYSQGYIAMHEHIYYKTNMEFMPNTGK